MSTLSSRISARFSAASATGRPRSGVPGACRLLVLAVAFAAWLALWCAPASALVTHPFTSSFDGSDAPGGPLGISFALAADTSGGASSGEVYVGNFDFNSGASSVYKFGAGGAYAGEQLTGTPAGPFSLVSFSAFTIGQVAVDSSASANSEDLYVADAGGGVVDRFKPDGTYDCQITGSSTASASECNGAAGSATPAGSFNPTGVAVDSSGDLYVADAAHDVVDVFGPGGDYLRQIADSHITQPAAIALDSAGDLYLTNANFFTGQALNVVKLDAAGAFVSVLDSNSPLTLAVDPATDHVFVGETSPKAQIAEYDQAGNPVAVFGADQLNPGGHPEVFAIAIGPSGNVYVSSFGSSSGAIDVFGPLVTVPDVTTAPPSDVAETSATLNGRVDPDTAHGGSPVTSCQFEYVDDAHYDPSAADPYSAGHTVPCSPSTPYTTGTVVSAAIGGLTQQTTYHFRLVAGNTNGSNQTADATFSSAGPPVLESESSTDVAAHTAPLHAQINPFVFPTSCKVEYVTDAAFGQSGYTRASSAPCDPATLSGAGDQAADVTLTGLAVATTYHYRFIVANQAGTATGADQTFTTFGIKSFTFEATDQNGSPYTQAGGHPYALTTDIQFNPTTTTDGVCATCSLSSPAGNFRDLITELPMGLVGDPTAANTCTDDDLLFGRCLPAAQIGTVELFGQGLNSSPTALYNLVPPKGVAARFGFNQIGDVTVFLDARVRTGGDYGITVSSLRTSQLTALERIKVTIWGVPADPGHDNQRACDGASPGFSSCPAGVPPKPFLTLPTSCTGPLTATLRADAWGAIGDFVTARAATPALTGCDRLPFNPSITVQPDTRAADSPSGLSVDLNVPQNDNPDGLATANLKKAVVTLPAGVSVNPAAANGLAACSPAQIGLDNANEPACPDASKIGSVEVDTPLLPNPLKGGVYVAQQNNNPFGSLLAIYVTAEDPVSGVLVKLAGHVVADPITGQLTTTFDNNPQVPFSDFKLDFFGGPHAALATPQSCGTFSTTSSLSPWSGTAAVVSTEPFPVTSGCVSGFSPSFTAGTENAQAGAHSPFVVSFSRSDTDQGLSGLTVKLPPGMLAKLAGVQECSEAQLAAAAARSGTAEQANPACPAGSQVGTVTTSAGTGPDPMSLTGNAYLTGPYKGSPYGLAVVVPAVAGPYDLGTVVVRQALYIDPTTAQVTAVSDPFPTILEGIPLRIRRVEVDLSRPDFTVNPTSCNPMAVAGTLTSTAGLTANMSSRFQVGGCSELGFSPRLKLRLSGKGKTHSGNHPSLTATLTDPSGQANIRSAKVALPLSMALDVNNSKNVCAFATAQAVHGASVGCPASTIVGQATAVTPLLSEPLSGPVYLVQGIRFGKNGQAIHTLPSLLIPLRGQIALDLRAQSAVSGGKLVTTFSTIPDAPVSKFTLKINGGRKGILVITGRGKTICGKKQVSNATFGAQSGKSKRSAIKMSTPCPATKSKKKSNAKKGRPRKKTAGDVLLSPAVARLAGG